MIKADFVLGVQKMLDAARPVLERCNVDVAVYEQEFEKRTVPQLKEGFAWLTDRMDAIDEYKKIRALRTEEIWEQYKHMDTEDFREVILLKEAVARIRKEFTCRPPLFRKVKDASKCKRNRPVEG